MGMFSSFEKTFPSREVKLPGWNLSLILKNLTSLPYELMKLSLDKLLTWKTSFLLAFTPAKRVSELHDLSYRVCHSRG